MDACGGAEYLHLDLDAASVTRNVRLEVQDPNETIIEQPWRGGRIYFNVTRFDDGTFAITQPPTREANTLLQQANLFGFNDDGVYCIGARSR